MPSDGTKNLIPLSKRTKEEQRVITTLGGKASGRARKEKADLKKALQVLLETEIVSKNGEKMSGAEALAAVQFQKALKGNDKSWELVRDTAGQKPVEQIEQTTTNVVVDLGEMDDGNAIGSGEMDANDNDN